MALDRAVTGVYALTEHAAYCFDPLCLSGITPGERVVLYTEDEWHAENDGENMRCSSCMASLTPTNELAWPAPNMTDVHKGIA